MPEVTDYFNSRLNEEIARNEQLGISSKYDEVMAASAEKTAHLAKLHAERVAARERNKGSLVTQWGLDPESLAGRATNLGASVVAGTSNNVIGKLATLPIDAMSVIQTMGLDEGDVQAYNNYAQGKATDADMARLNAPRAGMSEDNLSVLQQITRSVDLRDYSRRITENMDIGSLVHQGARDDLHQSLDNSNTKAGLEQVAAGWEGLKTGNGGKEYVDLAQGVGSLTWEAMKAAASNPQAAAEYIAENAPQLAVGAIAKIGGTVLAGTNLGYGLDLYQAGLDKYAKENEGAFPPEDVRQSMAAHAAAATAAEHVGDKAGLALAKAAGTTTKEAAKTSFKEALLNTGKAVTGGTASEAATEGFQTYAEGEANLKPATTQQIYEGATIGGIAGGGMSGGARGVAEALQATPEWADFKAAEVTKEVDQAKATKANDISGYENDPIKQIQILHGHANLETTTPEVKASNEAKINEIVTKMEEERAAIYDTTDAGKQAALAEVDSWTPEKQALNQDYVDMVREDAVAPAMDAGSAKKLDAQVARLDRRLDLARKLRDDLVQTQTAEIDLDAQVAVLNTPIDTADATTVEAHKNAASKVMTLAMAAPHQVDPEVAAQIAGNSANGLTDNQRTFLTAFSASRIAENRLKGTSKVGDEILYGNQAKNQLGIAQYRQKIAAAVQSGNTKETGRLMAMLKGWVDTQVSKANLFDEAYNEVKGTGNSIQIIPQNGKWIRVAQPMPQKKLESLGGLTVAANSPKLNANIQSGKAALESAITEMNALVGINSPAQATPGKAVTKEVVTPPVTTQSDANVSNRKAEEAATPPVEVKPAKEKKPKSPANKRDDLVGAILRVTGGAGLSRKIVEDAISDKISTARNGVNLVVGTQGTEDLGYIAELLRVEEGYDVRDANHLAELIAEQHGGNPVHTPERMQEENARNEQKKEQAYKREVSEKAKALGLKGVRGGRTVEMVLADMARLDKERSAMEAEEERAAIQMEADVIEALESNTPEEILALLSNEVTLTIEEVNNVESDSTTESQAADVTESSTGKGTEERNADGPVETGEGNAGLAETEGSPAGKLSVFDQAQDWAGEQLSNVFQKLNLVAEFVTQKVGKDTDKTQRPLVAVKDFLSAWNKDAGLARIFAGVDVLSDNQVTALQHFKSTANQWMGTLQKNLIDGYFNQKEGKVKPNPDFRYTDPVQFLLQQIEGKTDLDENVKLAIIQAAYSWVAENGYSSAFSTREDVKAMFAVQEHEQITNEFYALVSDLGINEQHLANAMGQKVIQALGLKAKKNAPQNLMAQLAASLGTHAMKILVDEKIIERSTVTGVQMQEGLPERMGKTVDPRAEMGLMRLTRNDDLSLAEKGNELAKANKGSQSILSKLFGVESDLIAPNWEARSPTQTRIRNTLQGIPKILKKYMKHEDSVPNQVRQDTWSLFQSMDEAVVLDIIGYEDFDEATTHVSNAKGLKAKNEGLKRELERVRDYFQELVDTSPLKLSQPLFFIHNVWKNQRVGIETNMVNPQTSKLHRGLLYRPEWETEVSSKDDTMMENFRLRVMEGLGIKTDKQSNETSLDDFDRMTDPNSTDDNVVAIREAVQAIQDSWDPKTGTWPEGQIPVEYQEAIRAGVKAGGEKMHSLDALIALAQYESAKATGAEFKFTVRMMGEIDGVTNGPMLSHLLLGAAGSVKGLFSLLNKGGFFSLTDNQTNYNLWRDPANKLNHRDLYETTIGHVMDIVNAAGKESPELKRIQDAVWAITGRLDKDDGSIRKEGRNIIKKPLTAMVFGSAVDGAIDSMFDAFVESTYAGFEKLAKANPEEREMARRVYLTKVSRLLTSYGAEALPNASVEDLLKYSLTKPQMGALRAAFDATIGDAVKETMKTHFSEFMDVRSRINNTAQASFALYDAVYQSIKGEFIKELEAKGDIFSRKLDGQGVAQIDLTAEQEQALQERIKAINPVVNTLMSQRSGGDLKTGLHVSKSSRKFSTQAAYQTSVKFANKLLQRSGKAIHSLSIAAYEQAMVAPGVAILPMMIHSLDSAISHMALMNTQVLNVHDAHGSGLKHFTRTAQNLNQATWKAVLEYSPTAEMREAWFRTVMGLDQMLQSGESVEAMVPALRLAMVELARKHSDSKKPLPLNKVLATISDQMTQAAYDADSTRLAALAQMAVVDQYALQGGQYEVTEADRAEAAQKLSELSSLIDPKVLDAIARINSAMEKVKDQPKAAPVAVQPMEEVDISPSTQQTPWGAVGPSSTASDSDIVEAFRKKPTMSAVEALRLAYASLKKSDNARMVEFYKRLVTQMAKVAPASLTVTMITPDTNPESVRLDDDGEHIQDAMGWYVSTEEGHSYVLSPEFADSGLNGELLIHEVLHGILAKIMQASLENDPDIDPAVHALVKELEDLRKLAEGYVKVKIDKKDQHKYKEALANVHEFVSYGMSNTDFQRNVLNKISFASKTKGNRLVDGMQAFISLVTGIIFRGSSKSQQAIMENGMSVLIQNVAGLMESTNKPEGKTTTHRMAVSPRDYTTQSLYDALRPAQSNLTPSFDGHLREMLGNIVEKIHGPFGSLMATRMENQIVAPSLVWDKAKTDNVVPFATAAMQAGFQISDQEAFAAEQVMVTVSAALDSKDAPSTSSYKELAKLYREMRDTLAKDGSDFNTGNPAQDQALYDFIFKMDTGANGKTDHLARFATLGLTNQAFNKVLDRSTSLNTSTGTKSLSDRLTNWLTKVLDWLTTRVTHTYAGQDADEKLANLVENLVKIEVQTRERLVADQGGPISYIEDKISDVANKAKDQIGKAAQSNLVRGSSNTFVKFAGNIVSTVAQGRVDELMNILEDFRNKNWNEHLGVTAGLVNEIRGARPSNQIFHAMLRASKHLENLRKHLITQTGKAVLESFANKGEGMTKEEKDAISTVFMRTDAASLIDSLGVSGISRVLNSKSALASEIAILETQLNAYNGFKDFFIKESKVLGYYLATGKVKGHFMLKNARNIARAEGTNRRGELTEAEYTAATEIIDQLVSLYALSYVPTKHAVEARNVLKREMARGTDNGIEMLLKSHRQLQQQSKERLFGDNGILMMKGYTPEIYDPHREIVVASKYRKQEMEDLGYIADAEVAADPNDPDQSPRQLYLLKHGGLRSRLTGIFSYTGQRAKGSRAATDEVTDLGEWKANRDDLKVMNGRKQKEVANLFKPDPNFDPSKDGPIYAAPVLTEQGNVTDYHYLMQHETMDGLLLRDNRFDKLMGTLAGSIFDKEASKEQNRKAVQALKEQYDLEYSTKADSYIEVSDTSSDAEAREIYRLLPGNTKKAIKDIWGNKPMKVRVDLLDLNFGYRKSSISSVFEKDPQTWGYVDKAFVDMTTFLFKKKASLYIRRTEDVFQEIVRETKDILVVKTGLTLLGNVSSNFTLLGWYGVPLKDQVHHHKVALRGAMQYRKDTDALTQLTLKLASNYVGTNRAEMEREVVRLKGELARNPVRELIEAGMMPTIVEDVAVDDDLYSYKSALVEKTNKFTKKLNPGVVAAGKVLYMGKDTKMYQALSYGTQISDFLAKYTLYQYLTTRKKDPLSHEEAIQKASDAFVNYDIPSHRTVQYLNDMGIVWFTKYYLRIQKVIAHLYKENPGRALMLLSLSHFFSGIPTLMDSSFIHKMHNPFSIGAFKYPSVLDELATVKLGMSPFN